MVDFSYRLPSAIDAVYAAPPSQQFKTAPPGTLTQEHRTDPRSSHRACLTTRDSLNRIGSASPLPQPVLRCKRRSQLSRYRSPVRPHVLHSLPHGYGEGDIYAIADGTYPSTWDALGTTKQASGQHQGRSLVHRQPVSLHELHPAHDGTVRRVDLYDFNSFPVTTGQKVRLDLAVAEGTASGRTCGTLPPAPLSSAGSPASQPPTASRLHARTPPHSPPRLQSTPPPDGGSCRRSPAAPATLSRSCHSHRFPTTAR